jgi:hypothetical protein
MAKKLTITVDMTRLRVRDLDRLAKAQKNSEANDFEVLVPLIARVCNLSEDEVWDWDIPTLNEIQQTINESIESGTVKKTNNKP